MLLDNSSFLLPVLTNKVTDCLRNNLQLEKRFMICCHLNRPQNCISSTSYVISKLNKSFIYLFCLLKRMQIKVCNKCDYLY